VHLVYSREDKSTALSYESEPSTPTSVKVNQVKDELVIKKEAKGKGKPLSKKAKVKEEQKTPQIKVYLLSYEHIIILILYRQSQSSLKLQNFLVLQMSFRLWKILH
jgi:hypothetical protein